MNTIHWLELITGMVSGRPLVAGKRLSNTLSGADYHAEPAVNNSDLAILDRVVHAARDGEALEQFDLEQEVH